jgi:hypothetical protein
VEQAAPLDDPAPAAGGAALPHEAEDALVGQEVE